MLLLFLSTLNCAGRAKQFKLVDVIIIEDRDGREHTFDRQVKEGKAIWCLSHKQYESVEVKRLQNQSNLIKAHAND